MRHSLFIRVVLLLAALLAPAPALAQRSTPDEGRSQSDSDSDIDAILSAIVQVRMKALPNARSSANLGTQREGSGVVIDAQGHIVTIGYVVTEAESIEVTTQAGRTVPAQLVAYDHATGLGLLRSTLPLEKVTPLPLGEVASLEVREPVMALPYGGREAASLAYVMSRRKFTASWEYLLESALFVSPPTLKWAGAALVNHEGKLVGIGSLLVSSVLAAGEGRQQLPGNMFVPVDELKPILSDLIARGRRAGPARPWLGLGTEAVQGYLLVANVSRQGPAEKAGIRRGDILLAIGSDTVNDHEAFYRRLWSMGEAGVEVPLKVLQGGQVKDLSVRSIDRLQFFQGPAVH